MDMEVTLYIQEDTKSDNLFSCIFYFLYFIIIIIIIVIVITWMDGCVMALLCERFVFHYKKQLEKVFYSRLLA